MKAVIIAGGFGTRLIPLTYRRPKHLLPLANRPFLEYQVSLLRRHGITDVVFATNYMADQIESHFGDGSAFGVSLTYALEEEPLGTAGAIRNAAGDSTAETIVVLNGDILTDFNLTEIISFHRERRAQATIALRGVDRPHAFGALETDPEGRVLSWNEPSEAQKKAVAEGRVGATGERDYINAGIYVLEPEVIDTIPPGRSVSIERETYPQLIATGGRVYGLETSGYWIDIGRPEQYMLANYAVLASNVHTEVAFERISPSATVSIEAEIDPLTSIGSGSRIGPGTCLSGCIILGNVTVGANCNLSGLIADDGVVFGADVTCSAGPVVAVGSIIERGSRL